MSIALVSAAASLEPVPRERSDSPSHFQELKKDSTDVFVDVQMTREDDLVNADDTPFKWTDFLSPHRRSRLVSPDDIATKRSVFDNPDLAPLYWPKNSYENLHRFDPKARWTYREEQAIVRKIDWRVMLWAAISFSALNLDRFNITQANTDNFLGDLGMTTDDFNLGNTVFHLAFLCAELPSQLISKRIGPDRWIPIQMTLWSVVSTSQFWMTGRATFLLCRTLLGLLQGGFIPDLILYLSYFYTKNELPIRLSLFWMSLNACSIVASFIAFGVLHLNGVGGQAGWRWLFLVEGLITLGIGLLTFFQMPPSPTQTRAWFRPNGWFNAREETIIVSRVLRDDPTKGDMHNREGLTLRRLWTAICDYDLWPLYILGLMFSIPNTPPSTYLTLSLRNIGFSTFQTNLLTIPSTFLGIITMFLISIISESLNERSIVAIAEDLWTLPFLIALYLLPENINEWAYFGIATALLSNPFVHPIQVGWCSRNSGAVASRTVNASLYNMFFQASSVISAQIYQASDAPRYRRGNLILIIICCFNLIVLYPGTKLYYIWRNRQKDKIWNNMTHEERVHYIANTEDVGNRRLDFRFAH